MGKEQVLVFGDDHFNTLGIIRSLGEAGFEPIAVLLVSKSEKAWVLRSKYTNKNFSCVVRAENAIDRLLCIGKSIQGMTYLIPSCDIAVKMIDDCSNVLRGYFILPSAFDGNEKLSKYLDKTYTAHIATRAGFKIPKTERFCASDMSKIGEIRYQFKEFYPLIIKEDSSVERKKHTKIVYTETELEQSLRECGNDYVMLQQFIVKDEELGIQGVGFGDKDPFVPAVIHKIRTSLDSMGSTTYAELRNSIPSNLKDKCSAFIKILNYSGIFDIEVLRKGEEYYFVECNFRNGAYGYAYTRMGYNLPQIWISSKVPPKSSINCIRVINGFNDVKHVRKGNISVIKWAKQMIKAEVKLTTNSRDLLPLFARILYH